MSRSRPHRRLEVAGEWSGSGLPGDGGRRLRGVSSPMPPLTHNMCWRAGASLASSGSFIVARNVLSVGRFKVFRDRTPQFDRPQG